DVMDQARAEKWAAPGKFPEWTERIKFFGDVRMRYEGNYFPAGNDNSGSFPNFNAINTGAPFDTSGTTFSPQNNVDQLRERLRLRARLGVDVNLESGWSAGIRIATGNDNSPVTANQTFGLANQAQGGYFSKYAIWLDRGFIKYEVGGKPEGSLSLSFGRFDNPFFTTSEIIWDEDVGFDGIALKARYEICSGVTPFVAGGFFPIFNTDFNFSSNQPAKYQSTDKWLYAAQFGFDLKFDRHASAKLAVSYFDFQGVEGQPSDPYIPFNASDASNTDITRPSFAQKGNTYRAIRNIVPDALNNFGTSNQFQYFGLASPFQVLSYAARLDFNYFEPFQVSLLGEYAKNLGFDKSKIEKTAVNNRGPIPATTATPTTTTNPDGTTTTTSTPPPVGAYEGGDTAWNLGLVVGKPVFEKAGDWSVNFGYRYVESDAVLDSFTDSDFAGGSTNVKGYTVGASVALSPRVKFGVRWMGATQIAGPPLKSDVMLIDLSAKF
ncbi:MAG: putative porin, partial [Verrucomicrobiaceae bacterium]